MYLWAVPPAAPPSIVFKSIYTSCVINPISSESSCLVEEMYGFVRNWVCVYVLPMYFKCYLQLKDCVSAAMIMLPLWNGRWKLSSCRAKIPFAALLGVSRAHASLNTFSTTRIISYHPHHWVICHCKHTAITIQQIRIPRPCETGKCHLVDCEEGIFAEQCEREVNFTLIFAGWPLTSTLSKSFVSGFVEHLQNALLSVPEWHCFLKG